MTRPASSGRPPKKSSPIAGWIKWEKDVETDPRFTRLVRKLRDTCVTQALRPETVVVGALVRLWSYADSHIRADDTLDLGAADIDDMVGLPGFCRSLPEDWLVIIDEEHVELPGYQEHNGVEAKKRDLATKRQQRKRARDRHADVTHVTRDNVTPALPDQTRPDQTKPDQRESERGAHARDEEGAEQNASKASSAAPVPPQSAGATKGNGLGVIEAGSNLTRSAEEWTTTPGVDLPSMRRWLGHLSTVHRWVLTPDQAVIHAKQLVENGDARAQADVVECSIGANSKSLIPIGDVRARKQGTRRQSGGAGTDSRETREQLDRDRLQKLMDSRASRGILNFRDPYPHEKADAYETQLRLAEQEARGGGARKALA